MKFNTQFSSSPRRPISDSSVLAQDSAPLGNTVPSLPQRPPLFYIFVSDASPSPFKALLESSRSTAIPEAVLPSPETPEANKMLYVIKDGVRELNQWCNQLIKYGEAVSPVKKDDSPKFGVSELDQWCNKLLLKYSEAVSCVKQDDSPKSEEGVKVDSVGEAFVVHNL